MRTSNSNYPDFARWTVLGLTILIQLATSLELTGFQWVSIELREGKVLTSGKHECIKISTFVFPRFNLMLEDIDEQKRMVSWNVDGQNGEIQGIGRLEFTNFEFTQSWQNNKQTTIKTYPVHKQIPKHFPANPNALVKHVWPIQAWEPFIGYYMRNATLSSQLIGHNPQYRDPLKNSEVLATGPHVSLPLSEPYTVVNMSGACFNVSLAIKELELLDFIPTTTVNPELMETSGAYFYDASRSDGVHTTASLPVWSVALVSLLLIAFIAAFVILLFVHLQSRRRINHNKLTIQHQTPHSANHHTTRLNTGQSGCIGRPASTNQHHGIGGVGGVCSSASSCHSSSSGQGMMRSNSMESHYDVPWDQKFRPLPDWLRTDLATALTDGTAKTVPVKPVPCPIQQQQQQQQHNTLTQPLGTGDSGVESLT